MSTQPHKAIGLGRRVAKSARPATVIPINPARANALASLAEAQQVMTRIDVPPEFPPHVVPPPPPPPVFNDLPNPQVDNWQGARQAATTYDSLKAMANAHTPDYEAIEPEEPVNPPAKAPNEPTEPTYRATLLTWITYTVAIASALFSGAIATYGLTKLAPGAEYVVFVLGLVYEAGKLTSFAVLHSVPFRFKVVLTAIGVVLMTLNIAGVSGFLSNAYERTAIEHRADDRTETTQEVLALLRSRVAAAEKAAGEASNAVLKAKANKGRVDAANAVLAARERDVDTATQKLEAAMAAHATAKAEVLKGGSEFAAVQFLAAAFQTGTDTITHGFILTLACIPDFLAVFLLLSAPYTRRRS